MSHDKTQADLRAALIETFRHVSDGYGMDDTALMRIGIRQCHVIIEALATIPSQEGAARPTYNESAIAYEKWRDIYAEQNGEAPSPTAAWHYATLCTLALAAPTGAVAPEGMMLVPVEDVVRAAEALGHFVSDWGWSDSDMQAMDNLDAHLAQHRAATPSPAPAADQPAADHSGEANKMVSQSELVDRAVRDALTEREFVHAESSRVYARIASVVRAGADDATIARTVRELVESRSTQPAAAVQAEPAIAEAIKLIASGDLEPILMRAGEERMRLALYKARQQMATGEPQAAVSDVGGPVVNLPPPDCTYADHSYPAYSRKAVLKILEKLAVPQQSAQAEDRDAERYRWLRDEAPGEIVFDHTRGNGSGGSRFVLHVPFDGEPVADDAESARRMDAAIDAAIAKEQATSATPMTMDEFFAPGTKLHAGPQAEPVGDLMQILHDPENQPSQYGTVPMEWLDKPTLNDAESDAVRMQMAALLDGVAVALRGDPGALRRWSWHDLPDRTAAAMAALQGAIGLATAQAEREALTDEPVAFFINAHEDLLRAPRWSAVATPTAAQGEG